MFLGIKLLPFPSSQKAKTAVATLEIAATEEVVREDVIELHAFTFQNRKDKGNFSNVFLKFVLRSFIPDKNNLLCTEVTDSIVQLDKANHFSRENTRVKPGC